jgi:octaprenyl-diphosphate synthase
VAKVNKIEIPSKINIIKEIHSNFSEEINSVNSLILDNLKCGQDLIYEAGEYLINSGGKRIRPLLVLISAKLFDYKGINHIVLAAATEFIHAATLLHDDVIDESMLRRFKPTVNSVWGNKEAILVGDYLFSKAFQLMVSTNSIESLKCLSKAANIIAIGEVNQLSLNNPLTTITEDQYFNIVESKTAELMAAAAKVGSVISSNNEKNHEILYSYGKILGTIFQIKDDLLDYLSTSEKIGKNVGDDFFESKITLPIILLKKFCNQSELIYLEEIFSKNFKKTTSELEYVISSLKKYDIQTIIDKKILSLRSLSQELVKKIDAKNRNYIDFLNDLAIFASERES